MLTIRTERRTPAAVAPWVAVVTALLSALFAAHLPAEDASPLETLERRIDIELRDAAASDVFAAMGKILQVELELDPAVAERSVTIAFQQVSARTALNALCESVDCRWRLTVGDDARLSVRDMWTPEEAAESVAALLELEAEMALADAGMIDVVHSMANLLQANSHLDPALDAATVTIDLPRQSLRQSLDAICAQVGCRWDVVDSGRGERPLLRIVPQ